jgi:hypothetical protein
MAVGSGYLMVVIITDTVLVKESSRMCVCAQSNPRRGSNLHWLERELVTGNEIPRLVAHKCIIEASIGKHIESPHSQAVDEIVWELRDAGRARPLKRESLALL